MGIQLVEVNVPMNARFAKKSMSMYMNVFIVETSLLSKQDYRIQYNIFLFFL